MTSRDKMKPVDRVTAARDRKLAASKAIFLTVLTGSANVSESARATGWSRNNAYYHRDADAIFADAWAEAVEIAVDALEREAWRRGMEGVQEPLTHHGQITYKFDRERREFMTDEKGDPIPVTITKYDNRLMEILLKAHRPDKYRERHQVDHDIRGGVLIVSRALDEVEWIKAAEAQQAKHRGSLTEEVRRRPPSDKALVLLDRG